MKASNISRMVWFAVRLPRQTALLDPPTPTVILNRTGRFYLSLLPLRSNISTLPQRGRPAGVRTASSSRAFLREGSLFGFKVFEEGCPMKAPA